MFTARYEPSLYIKFRLKLVLKGLKKYTAPSSGAVRPSQVSLWDGALSIPGLQVKLNTEKCWDKGQGKTEVLGGQNDPLLLFCHIPHGLPWDRNRIPTVSGLKCGTSQHSRASITELTSVQRCSYFVTTQICSYSFYRRSVLLLPGVHLKVTVSVYHNK